VQLILTDEGAQVLEAALEESLSQLRTRMEQSGSDVDRARLERAATVIRKILQQLATQGLSHII
jgi:KaiC/GvpD/RAD55 family RecA-like ATPase